MNTPNEYDGVTKNSIIKVNVSQGVIEEEKIVNINTNTQTVIEPDEGYDAIEKVTVNTNIPNETTTLVAVSNGNYNPVSPYIGYNSVSVNVPNQVTSLSVNNNGIYTPVSPYIGYNSVSVNVPQISNEYLQNKRITSNGDYTIQGLMNYPQNYDGVSKNSNIIVDVPTPDITQISNYSITANGTQTVPIPSGYDAVDSISLNVQVPTVITIDRINYNNSEIIYLNTFNKWTASGSVNISNGYVIVNYAIYSDYVKIYYYFNNTGATVSKRRVVNSSNVGYYKTMSNSETLSHTMIKFANNNGNNVFSINDYGSSNNSYETDMLVYRRFFDFTKPS